VAAVAGRRIPHGAGRPLGELLSPDGSLVLLLMLAAVLALLYVFTRFMFRLLTQQMVKARQSR
jgi:hypothetical protein